MKSKYFKIICLSAGLSTMMVTSCKKFVEIDPPINAFNANTAYDTDDLVKSNIAGLHSYNFIVGSGYYDTDSHLFPGMSADEISYYTTLHDEFLENNIQDANVTNRAMWTAPYKTIYQSNLMLTALEKATKISAPVKAEAFATAKFFRGLAHLNLVSIYGDVPLILTSDVKTTTNLPRTAKAEVYKQIIADLLDAKASFKGINKTNLYANEKSTTAILARAYLYDKQWQKAADAASELISGPLKGNLALEEVGKMFQRVSKETILAISSEGSNKTSVNYTYAGQLYIPTVRTIYNITPSLYNAFEVGDLRKANWIGTFNGTVGTTYYPLKYKLRGTPTNTALAEDQVLIRLSEMVLTRAEALAQLDKTSEAMDDVNAIRVRAGLTALPKTLAKADVLLAVEKERRLELFSEGHRWIDLVRTGRADAVLGALKGAKWKSYAQLYPVPAKEIELNPNLIQNPGYNK
jgi:hypothetical protein